MGAARQVLLAHSTVPVTLEITEAALEAGDVYLQTNTDEFSVWGYGEARPGINIRFVKNLLEAVCQASGIELRIVASPSSEAGTSPLAPSSRKPL
jgi:hypothetical protein